MRLFYFRLHLRASWRRPKHCRVLSGPFKWQQLKTLVTFRITLGHHVVSSKPLGSWSYCRIVFIPTWISKVRRVSGRLFFQDEAEEVGRMQKSQKSCWIRQCRYAGLSRHGHLFGETCWEVLFFWIAQVTATDEEGRGCFKNSEIFRESTSHLLAEFLPTFDGQEPDTHTASASSSSDPVLRLLSTPCKWEPFHFSEFMFQHRVFFSFTWRAFANDTQFAICVPGLDPYRLTEWFWFCAI